MKEKWQNHPFSVMFFDSRQTHLHPSSPRPHPTNNLLLLHCSLLDPPTNTEKKDWEA